MTTTFTRRSSLYTVHFDTTAEATQFAADLDFAAVPIQDRGTVQVSFRARDDDDAAHIACTVTSDPVCVYRITTGLGVHKREVQP